MNVVLNVKLHEIGILVFNILNSKNATLSSVKQFGRLRMPIHHLNYDNFIAVYTLIVESATVSNKRVLLNVGLIGTKYTIR